MYYNINIVTKDCTIWCSMPSWGNIILPSPKHCDWFWGPPNHLINGYRGGSTKGVNRLEHEVSTHLNLVMRLRMSAVLPLLPLSTSPQYQTLLAGSQHNNVLKADHKKGWS